METESANEKEYELSFLAKEEKGKEAVFDAVRRARAEVTRDGAFERIPLAYAIEKETAAYFGFLHLRALPEAVEALRKDLGTRGEVLRFLIVHPPFHKQEARGMPLMRGKASPVQPLERKRPSPLPLSNEALERKIEEILKE